MWINLLNLGETDDLTIRPVVVSLCTFTLRAILLFINLALLDGSNDYFCFTLSLIIFLRKL